MRLPTLSLALLLTCGLASAPLPARAAQPGDLNALAGQGREAMAAGDFDRAAELYARIVERLPDEAGMRLNLGMALSMAGHFDEAVEHLEAAARLQPGLPAAALFLGMARMELGQPARAVEPLQSFLASQPGHFEARQMLAEALLLEGRFEQAAEHYRRVTEQAARDPRAWYGLGRAYEGVAGAAFEAMQRTAPESPLTTLLVAEAMVASGRDANAFRLFREVLEARPDMPGVHEALALIYERRDHPEWAAVERERARQVPPRDCGAGRESMECDFQEGRYLEVLEAASASQTAEALYWKARAANEGARQALARLASLPPSPEATLVDVGVRRAHRAPPGEAIDELRTAVETWPRDGRLRLELIRTLFATGETEEIRPLLEEQLALNPRSTELAVMSGETWLRLLKPQKAIPYFERALAIEPELAAAQVALGRAYMEAGETERAIAPLEAALESDRDGAVHYRLARAYREIGQPEKAREIRERFEEVKRLAADRARRHEDEFKITSPDEPVGR